jgi:hypothetical protein
MTQLFPEPGRTIHDIAAIAGIDWRVIAEQNDLDLFAELPINSEVPLDVPSVLEAIAPALPVLSSVGNTVRTVSSQAKGILSRVSGVANQIADVLPPSLKGYVSPALDAIASANGVIDNVTSDIDSFLSGGGANQNSRTYNGAAVRLIDWMFSR